MGGEVQLRPFLTAAADGGDFNSHQVQQNRYPHLKAAERGQLALMQLALAWSLPP